MVNTRRVARELALKALFQVDVGKQPVAEAVAGAAEQVCGPIDNALSQAVHAARDSLRSIASQAVEAHGEMSPTAKRQLSQTSTAMQREIRDVTAIMADSTRRLVGDPGSDAVQAAANDIRAATGQSRSNIARLALRSSAYPDEMAAMAQTANHCIQASVSAFERGAQDAWSTSALLHRLVSGTLKYMDEIDASLAQLSPQWALDRQAAVDRNILRLAAFEIRYLPEIPPGASINEAVELAKKYSTAESGRFVNGVLGAFVERCSELSPASSTTA